MCKNFMLTNTANLSEKSFLKLRKLVAKTLTNGNDDDGLGYATFNTDGNVYGERFLDVNDLDFQMRPNHVATPIDTLSKVIAPNDVPEELQSIFVPDVVQGRKDANFWGEYSKPVGAFIMHARLATNAVNIGNTHPHCTDEYTLIHNGMVQNAGDIKSFKSTCDSEYLVAYLSKHGIKGMVENVTGYYAIGALEHSTGNLLIVKDAKAPLYSAFVKSIGALMITTSLDHLKAILKGMQWNASNPRALQSNVALTFDFHGTLLSQEVISPKVDTPKSWGFSDNKFNKQVESIFDTSGDYNAKKPSSRFYNSDDFWNNDKAPKSKYVSTYDQEESEFWNKYYDITTAGGSKISYKLYEGLSEDDKESCIISEKDTGRKVYV